MAGAEWNAYFGRLLVEELRRCGAGRFVVSPGSRSTPITLAVAADEAVETRVHYDERGAAWFALGWAKAVGGPVCLVCTSGTAAANYLPALIEASMSFVPLIVLTADRPPELLDAGANQAIVQPGLYGKYVRWEAALPCPGPDVPPESLLTAVDQAVYRATNSPAGPVHLDCMFREPLVAVDEPRVPDAPRVERWRRHGGAYTSYSATFPAMEPMMTESLARAVDAAERGVIIAGQITDPEKTAAVAALAERLQWPVFPDVLSGMRLDVRCATSVLYYDQVLQNARCFDEFRPDVVLQFGTPVTSKTLLKALREHPPRHYLLVAEHPYRHDPIHGVTARVEMPIAEFCNELMLAVTPEESGEWLAKWVEASLTASQAMADIETGDLTEPGVARLVSAMMPKDGLLLLGNSMPIRDFDMYGAPGGRRYNVFGNRGASGIDGNIATAAGLAMLGHPVVAVMGDLAFLHDVNSLRLLHDVPGQVVLVVINNNGGGIFSFLPIAKATEYFEEYWAAPHGMRFGEMASAFGLQYARPESPGDFAVTYERYRQTEQSAIIEVTTERAANHELHEQIRERVIRALE
jgi:2-succinyl-5-enolpyruvyl-6-hydroxy-3-cyclohexene-1-carboxylate synthase